MTRKTHRIAVIPGDGIGREVMPEGLRVLEAAARRFGISLETQHIDWASCDYYQQHGQMMPDDWKQQLQGMDAILFGAVGWPATVPDHVSLWGSLLKFRREFDQYINLRPVRLFEGVPCPLANRKRGDIDYYVVLARFKMAIVLEGGYARHVKGSASNPKVEAFGPIVLDMAEKAALLARESKLPPRATVG